MSRILFATIGSLGDVHPMMAMGQELVRLGHQVTIATSDRHGHRIIEAGLNFAEIPPKFPAKEEQNRLMERWMDPKHGSDRVVRELIMPNVRATHEALEPLVKDADLVLLHGFAISGAFWAERFGRPWGSLPLAPMMFTSEHEPPVVAQLLHPERLKWFGTPYPLRWLMKLAFWANGLGWKGYKQIRREMGQEPIHGHPFFDFFMDEADLVLAPFSQVLGRRQPDWPARTVQTGFAFFDQTDDELEDESASRIDQFLASGPPPIVFSLGSTGVYTAGDFYIQAWQAARQLGQRAILMIGPDEGVKRPENPGPDCLIVKYAPHVRVFPRSAIVVHHGGVNTTGQAFRAGRPQLVVPLAHDQFDNAARVVRSGCGLTLPKSQFTSAKAVGLLKLLLGNASFAQNAAQAAATVAGEGGASGAAGVIHQFLANRAQAGGMSR